MLSFSNFTVGFHGFHRKNLKIIQYDFGTGARKKIWWLTIKTIEYLAVNKKIVVNNKDNDVLKTSIFALEALLLGQIFALRTSDFRGAINSR